MIAIKSLFISTIIESKSLYYYYENAHVFIDIALILYAARNQATNVKGKHGRTVCKGKD